MPKRAMELLTESMFYVLMALREGEMCGADAAEYIARCTGGRVQPGPATLYTILAKFEKEKYKGLAAYDAELLRLRRCLTDAERQSAQAKEA